MDFSGKVGRVLDDSAGVPNGKCSSNGRESGYSYFRLRRVSPKELEPLLTEVQKTAHEDQPWFHPGVGRDAAQRILAAQGVDG